MSKIAKAPVELPAGVTATIAADAVTIKGAKGSLSFPLTAGVSVVQTDKKLQIRFDAEGLARSEEHTSELQSRLHLVCRLLLEKKKKQYYIRSLIYLALSPSLLSDRMSNHRNHFPLLTTLISSRPSSCGSLAQYVLGL